MSEEIPDIVDGQYSQEVEQDDQEFQKQKAFRGSLGCRACRAQPRNIQP